VRLFKSSTAQTYSCVQVAKLFSLALTAANGSATPGLSRTSSVLSDDPGLAPARGRPSFESMVAIVDGQQQSVRRPPKILSFPNIRALSRDSHGLDCRFTADQVHAWCR